MSRFVSFMRDEESAMAIEYGLIAGLVAIVIVAALSTVGFDVADVFTGVVADLRVAAGAGSTV